MSFELRLSPEAVRSIQDQLRWYEADELNGGAGLADRWLNLLEAALDALCGHPARHGFAPENGRWMPSVSIRQIRFKPWKTPSAWRVLYTIDDQAKLVTVLQVRHEKRPLLSDDKR